MSLGFSRIRNRAPVVLILIRLALAMRDFRRVLNSTTAALWTAGYRGESLRSVATVIGSIRAGARGTYIERKNGTQA
jgi:hypothetical protein